MARDLVEICNSALTKLGAASIMSLDDGSVESIKCKLRIDPIRRIVLRLHPWNCAIDRRTLAAEVGAPAFEFAHLFQLPSNCLRLLEVDTDQEYRVEGRRILSDENSLSIRFVQDLEDPTQMDELLSEAIACYLAWDICYPLTQNLDLKTASWKVFGGVLREAKSVDAKEEPGGELEDDTFLKSRGGS